MLDHSFKSTWNAIIQNKSQNESRKTIINDLYMNDDSFFDELPDSQEYLTENQRIINKKIEYSMFIQNSANTIDRTSLYECFHGILNYIYYYSDNKFNTEEIMFHFSGGKSRKKFSTKNNPNETNILNIFNYKNIKQQFTIKSYKNAFIGITFKRISIVPVAYSIRSGPSSNRFSHLYSFTFDGYDKYNKKWDTLDERVNINDLIYEGGFNLYYVRTTKKSYSSFRIRQTEKGNNGNWGFSISAFEIHGIVLMNDSDSTNYKSNDLTNHDFKFDPIMDMTEYILYK